MHWAADVSGTPFIVKPSRNRIGLRICLYDRVKQRIQAVDPCQIRRGQIPTT